MEASAAHAAIAWQSPLPTLLCEILTGIVLTPWSIFEAGMMNNANDIHNTYMISFVRFGSVRKRRLTCEICSLISCSIYQLPFWLKIQFVITHFRLIGLPGPG